VWWICNPREEEKKKMAYCHPRWETRKGEVKGCQWERVFGVPKNHFSRGAEPPMDKRDAVAPPSQIVISVTWVKHLINQVQVLCIKVASQGMKITYGIIPWGV